MREYGKQESQRARTKAYHQRPENKDRANAKRRAKSAAKRALLPITPDPKKITVQERPNAQKPHKRKPPSDDPVVNLIREKAREAYYANKEKKKQAALRWRRENPEKCLKWREDNADRIRAYDRERRKTPHGKAKSINATVRHREMKKKTPVALRATTAEIRELLERATCCRYCRRTGLKLTVDHFMPLKRGGAHSIENLVAACGRCNSSKGARDPIEFMASLGELALTA